ncbi:uncharacterized protein K460DRAFT_400132 [Cucurbitaria berberidis CBS 394.84]|uniref:Integral membrane protein n=1 Tax=Cucurbitaria berberidis CBS 394.84 TaxID=1168544 RepID=A0A9P4GS38_9PLEO|nr:uncharacterized protein K460DRAFT_400132 [Cucurbitaria berberidis CBS 394.84]KAF1850046.1 hypothetical protein K460DRAFT_400132 [Cucurbitaria berberidis CBS 394.84]
MSPYVRFTIITASFIGLILIYTIRSAALNDPTSLFFNPQKGYALRYSTIRHQQAEAFISSYNSTLMPKAVKAGQRTNKLCIGIPSIGRRGAQYMRETVGSLLEGLTPDERSEIYLMVFIPHADPAVHSAYSEEWLHTITDHVLTYDFEDHEKMQHIRDMEDEGGQFEEKGLYDYSYLLSKCMEQHTPYIAIFEDDTLAMDGWYHRTVAAIRDAEHQSRVRKAKNFLYLRLFYTEEYLGWNSEDWKTYLYHSMCVAAVLGAILFLLRVSKPAITLSRTVGTIRAIVATYSLLAVFILVFFALGRLTVLPSPNGVHEMSRFGCCSQAFVFPRQKAIELVDYFEKSRIGFVDVLIEKFADERRELRFALTPSVVQHVGKKSSKLDIDGSIYKEKIWSFGFEAYDWKRLRSEHEDTVKMKTGSD